MDFTNRNRQHNNQGEANFRPSTANATVDSAGPVSSSASTGAENGWPKWRIWGTGILIIAIALMIGAILWLSFSTKPVNEAKMVDTNNLQAVFLNNNQVYFGNITAVNGDYLVLDNIYYLQSPKQVSNKSTDSGNVSLVKLGCELHRPQDQMVINQSQVSFWENLQKDGQVAKAVTQYQSAHPQGQQCDSQPTSGQQSPTTDNSTNNTSDTTDTNNAADTSNQSTDTNKKN